MKSITGCVGEEVELGRVGARRADHVTGELDDAALQPEAEPEVRDAVLAGVARGEDLALDAAVPEAAGHQDAGDAGQSGCDVLGRQRLRVDPAHADVALVRPAGMAKRLGHREVGVGQLDVLADERDLELPAWAA